jgi:hypothetical protein
MDREPTAHTQNTQTQQKSTQQTQRTRSHDITLISNELEFNILGVSAREVLAQTELPIVREVNPEHVVEMNVSLAKDITELNSNLESLTRRLIERVEGLGGQMYAGASLIENVTDVRPVMHRTTALSQTCARGFLDITSQQIVIGVQGEQFGIQLYNYLRTLNPAILALSTSSPYALNCKGLADTGMQSRRMIQYRRLASRFPRAMLESRTLESTEHYFSVLQEISDEVNRFLSEGRLDPNPEELYMQREKGAYAPFQTLAPHQIYWMTRFRPDHKNDQSDFSIELRVPDIPTSTERMQMLNSWVIGLCYYASDRGFTDLPRLTIGSEIDDLENAAREGTYVKIGGVALSDSIRTLTQYSSQGLAHRGYGLEAETMTHAIDSTLRNGTDAEQIRKLTNLTPEDLRGYLVRRLKS